MALPLTLQSVILTLKEFLIVWINQVIYYNDIYPVEIYDKLKSFDVLVYISRNPIFNKYIENFVNDFLRVLVKGDGDDNGGKVNKMSLLLYDMKSNKTKRRYVLKFNEMINFGSNIDDLTFLYQDDVDIDSNTESIIDIPHLTWDDLFSQLKSLLHFQVEELKRKEHEKDTPDQNDLFYKIVVDLEDSVNLVSNDNSEPYVSNWIRLNPSVQEVDKTLRTNFIPIGEVSVGFICIDIFNEYLRRSKP